MTNLTGAPSWDSVPQIDTTTQLLGGLGGPLNLPAQALLNRSEYLRSLIKTNVVTTLYVRTDGSDANDGSANNAQHAFATVQKALDVAMALNVTNGNVLVQLGNTGNYAGGMAHGAMAGNSRSGFDGHILVQGDTVTPGNTVLTSGLTAGFGSYLCPQYLTIATGTSGSDGFAASEGGVMNLGPGLIFGDCGNAAHCGSYEQGILYYYANTTITGKAAQHINAWGRAYVEGGFGNSVTLQGVPAFSIAFVSSLNGSFVLLGGGIGFTGAASGFALNQDASSQFKGREWGGPWPTGLTFQPVQGVVASTFVPSAPVTVGNLVSAGLSIRGARQMVTDSTVSAAGNFGAAVVGGGANVAPVWCDGATWRIG